MGRADVEQTPFRGGGNMPEVILPKMEHCPCCNTTHVLLMKDQNPLSAESPFYVQCEALCHRKYPTASATPEEAIAKWNALPRAPEWQEQPKVNEWNRWTDGTCNNVTFIRQDGTGVVSGCLMHWKEIGDRWFPIPTPEDVT